VQSHRRTLKKYVANNGKCPFDEWLDNLKDIRAQAIISTRLNRVIQGNFGNCRSVGGEVRELKIDFGSGYRVYFAEDGKVLVVLLCGGDKRSQWKDIENAKKYWREYCETKTS
jgi:putative addiction module killer protein